MPKYLPMMRTFCIKFYVKCHPNQYSSCTGLLCSCEGRLISMATGFLLLQFCRMGICSTGMSQKGLSLCSHQIVIQESVDSMRIGVCASISSQQLPNYLATSWSNSSHAFFTVHPGGLLLMIKVVFLALYLAKDLDSLSQVMSLNPEPLPCLPPIILLA